MTTQHYSIHINAPKEKVWNTMLDQGTYREWTSVFGEGGRFEGSWDQGSKILFVGTDPESGKDGGMVSRIKENRAYEFISIEHLGIMKDGVEDTTSEEAKKFAPAYENYTFSEKEGGTELSVDVDVAEEFADFFTETWPKGLAKLKELSEQA
ncbi:MAG: 2-oxoglutarate dehydrogenase complex, dehydrogenase component [Parcubacteria bacterium C7867-004]|nr:MAG: 2-oxoglutarate dehydrogenase complex, dehydrogenase component [Parcubacteria bacterium C7867-004]